MSVLAELLHVAAIDPQEDAVKDSARQLTYGHLSEEIARVATGLHSLDVRVGDRVVIRLATSVDALVVAFSCMWIGAIFVPVSPGDPTARLAGILADCEPTIIVGRPDDPGIPQGPWTRVTFNDLNHPDAMALAPPPEDGPAYCIYTSGTTGTPKGVVVGHRSFAHAVQTTIKTLGMGPRIRVLCISAFHFDGSFSSLFTTLTAGGTLIILRREPMVLPRAFIRTVREEQIGLVFCSPSFLRLLLTSPSLAELVDSPLVQIVFGGEASTVRHLVELITVLPAVRLYNQYGPTETVISVALHEITRDQLEQDEVPIGQPHPDVVFLLFDEQDRPVMLPGEPGELHVGGAQLMEGYWADPELSAQVLRRDLIPGSVFYRTGDLVKRNAAGHFVYMGRTDRIVKRTGMRISLDEIERYLRQLPGVTNAACIASTDDDTTRIIAYAAIKGATAPVELFAGLTAWLPRSMIPDTIDLVATIPLTAAGKVDYRALANIQGL